MKKMKIFLKLFLVIAIMFSSGTWVLGYSAAEEEISLAAMAEKLETTGYKAYEADAGTLTAAKAKAQELIGELLVGSGINAKITDSANAPAFVAATTIDSTVQPNVDGKYKFTVTLSKGTQTPVTTKELTMTIVPEIDDCLLYETIYHLVSVLGPRIAGTITEYRAHEYIKEQFEKVDGGDNVYNIATEEYMFSWVPERGIQVNPNDPNQYGYLIMNARQQYGVIEADVPSGAAAVGIPAPNNDSFKDFEGGYFHDFGVFDATTNKVSSAPIELRNAILAAGGKVYGTLRFDRAVTGEMIDAAVASIKAAYGSNIDVTGLFIARIDSAPRTRNAFAYTYNDVPVSVSNYTTGTTSVIGLTLIDLEKAKAAGEAGIISKVYRIDPKVGWVTTATKPAADPDNPDLVIVYTSHIDTVRGAPGATDTATGVSALVELARRFKDVPNGNIEIIFAAIGAEEYNDFSASSYLIEKLRAEGKDVVTVNMNFDTPAAPENGVNVLGDPIDTWALGIIKFEEQYMYPNFRNDRYGINYGRETAAFNLAAYLLTNFAGEISWPTGISNVRINNWGASDHAMWAYFGIDACRPSSVARGGNFAMNDANTQVYGYKYHSSLDNMDIYNYESHLKTTNLLANGIQKAIDLKVTKRAKFLFNKKEGTVTLENAEQLFKIYDAVTGTLVGPNGDIPFKFTPENTVISLANANEYVITNLSAIGTGIGNHNETAMSGNYTEFTTSLVGSMSVVGE